MLFEEVARKSGPVPEEPTRPAPGDEARKSIARRIAPARSPIAPDRTANRAASWAQSASVPCARVEHDAQTSDHEAAVILERRRVTVGQPLGRGGRQRPLGAQ